jgi:predicted LPLAT superfamily acyltransferase
MSWIDTRERGNVLGLRLTLWTMRVMGYRFTRWVIGVVAFYYTLFSPTARRHLAAFHRRAAGRSSFSMAYGTIRNFAEGLLDRVYMLMGRTDLFSVTGEVCESAEEVVQAGRGAVMLCAHVGPIEVGRLSEDGQRFNVTPVVQTAMSPVLYRELKRFAPDVEDQMVLVEPGAMDLALTLRERIEAGEIVAVMADRVGDRGAKARLPFLGAEADFPMWPYAIATSQDCPVFTALVARTGPATYVMDIREVTTDPGFPATRAGRRARMKALAEVFVERLETYCRRFPSQWYNFHDFWGDERPGEDR